MFRKIVNKFLLFVSCFIILIALLLSILRIVVDVSNIEKPWFERILSYYVHHPVSIGYVDTDWLAWSPSLRIRNLKIYQSDHNKELIAGFKKFNIGFAFIEWMKYHSFILVKVSASDGELNINAGDSNFFSFGKVVNNQLASNNLRPTIWLAGHSYISLKNISLKFDGQTKQPFYGLINKLQTYHYEKNRIISGVLSIQNNKQFIKIVGKIPENNVLSSSMQWYFGIHNLPLDLFEKYLTSFNVPIVGTLQNGIVNSDIWMNILNGKVVLLKSKNDIKKLAIKTNLHLQKSIYIRELKFDDQWRKQEKGWSSYFSYVSYNNQKLLYHSSLSVFFNDHNGKFDSYVINIPNINLHDMFYVRNYITDIKLPNNIMNYISHVYPSGSLEDFRLRIQKKDNHILGVSSSFDFHHISLSNMGVIPATLNISGSVITQNKQGQIHLSSHGTLVMSKKMTGETIPISSMEGIISWKKMQTKTVIKTRSLKVSNSDFDIHIHPTVITKDERGFYLDSDFSYDLQNLSKVISIIPRAGLKPKLVTWLNKAFTDQGSIHGDLIWRGYVKDFPYKKNQGYFEALASLDNVDLYFNKKWPTIHNIQGNAEFINNEFLASIDSAKIRDIPLDNIKLSIPNLKKPHLNIVGKSSSSVNVVLANLKYFPIGLASKFHNFAGSGLMLLHLHLDLPFKNHFRNKHYEGDINFENSSLIMPWFTIPINSINGTIHFSNDIITAKNLTGSLFNNLAHFNIATNQADQVQKITIQSQIPVEQIRHYFGWSFLDNFSGVTPYKAILLLANKKQRNSSLAVFSSLQGITSHFPVPLKKSSVSKTPFELNMIFPDSAGKLLSLNIAYGSKLNAKIELKKKKNIFNISRGVVAIGNIKAKLPKVNGLDLIVVAKKFDWNKWLNCFKGFSNNDDDTLLNQIYIQTPLLKIFGQNVRTAYVVAKNLDPNWKININSENVVGTVVAYFDRSNPFYLAKFDRLYLSKSQYASALDNKVFDSIPSMHVSAEKFHFSQLSFGSLDLDLKALNHKIVIDKLLTKNDDNTMLVNGYWLDNPPHVDKTVLNMHVNTKNLGSLLHQLHTTNVVRNGGGVITYAGGWLGAPNHFDKKTLYGKVTINVQNGMFINLGDKVSSEMGIGKLLNIFSLQTLQRRLSLNFNDLTDKGFSFNQLNGDFVLQDGKAQLQHLTVNGPVAKVDVGGHVDYINKYCNLTINVSPYVTSSAPVIATLAGGPVVGAIAWVVNKIISPGLGKIIRFSYNAKGSWDHIKFTKSVKS